jgi:hypothetical protein
VNRLGLHLVASGAGHGIDIVVDGVRLAERLGLSDEVAPLSIDEVAPLGRRIWLGDPVELPLHDAYLRRFGTPLFTCACGILGCRGVFAVQTVSGGQVVWRDFNMVGTPLRHPAVVAPVDAMAEQLQRLWATAKGPSVERHDRRRRRRTR